MYNLSKIVFLLSMLVIVQTGFAQKSGKKALDQDLKQVRNNVSEFNWESLSKSKEVFEKFDSVHLSGTWKAFNGLFNFNGIINSMNLFKPFVIQIDGASIRRSENSTLAPFEILNNKLLVKGNEIEEGFINMLTNKLLVISWKSGSNYTRYYYERTE